MEQILRCEVCFSPDAFPLASCGHLVCKYCWINWEEQCQICAPAGGVPDKHFQCLNKIITACYLCLWGSSFIPETMVQLAAGDKILSERDTAAALKTSHPGKKKVSYTTNPPRSRENVSSPRQGSPRRTSSVLKSLAGSIQLPGIKHSESKRSTEPKPCTTSLRPC